MPFDSDTQKYLEEVKKGKPRRFAMIMKGEQILSLIIYKKGTVEKYKKQAKEEGKGQFYFGVVEGKGQNITFKLSIDDGFDSPPGKDVKLKAFLNEESGMKFKPVYEIVTELPGVDESDEGETAPEAPPMPTSTTDAPPKAPPSPQVDATTFMSRLKTMLPALKQAQAVDTPFKGQLRVLVGQAQSLGKEQQYGKGMQTLDELESVIKRALSHVKESSTSDDGFLKRWQSARNDAVGQIRDLATAVAATKDPDAREVIIELQSIIKNLASNPSTPREIAEMERYVRDDDVITAAEEVPPHIGTLSIRQPLLAALQST